jgi:hypothetical protein
LDCETLCALGFSSLFSGDVSRAQKYFQCSLNRDPDYVFAYLGLAKSRLSGAGYIEVIERLVDFLRPKRYVEIGVERGAVLGLLAPSTRVVGVDPEPQFEADSFPQNVSIFLQTSDDFFAANDLSKLLGGAFDLAFIDGLHTFEQVLKDFINLEKYAASDSVILIHDCLPLDRRTSSPERETVFWTGDVWKIIPCLKRERPELQIFTIPTYPAGLGVVSGLRPGNIWLSEQYSTVVAKYQNLDFSYIEDHGECFSLVANRWSVIAERLRPLRTELCGQELQQDK